MGYIINLILHFGIIELFSLFFIMINIFTFGLYVFDKRLAEKNKHRISENTLIFFTLICGGIGALLGMIIARHKTKKIKFRVVVIIGMIIAIIPVIHVVHSLTLDRTIRYTEAEFRSENWPSELNGYRIAFMTDLHVITDETMSDVIAALNEKNIDLLLLGGDFSMGNGHYRGTLREIAQANAVDGIFGVEGNHDDYRMLFAAKEQYGITPLDNSGQHIRSGFYLAGVRDLWNGNPDIAEATSGAYADDFILLVSHNPDISMIQSTAEIGLIVSGHTHSGQITLFGYPMYLLQRGITRYGTRFSHGFADAADGTQVFTSSGIGVYYSIPRIFARPEVVIFTMYNDLR